MLSNKIVSCYNSKLPFSHEFKVPLKDNYVVERVVFLLTARVLQDRNSSDYIRDLTMERYHPEIFAG